MYDEEASTVTRRAIVGVGIGIHDRVYMKIGRCAVYISPSSSQAVGKVFRVVVLMAMPDRPGWY